MSMSDQEHEYIAKQLEQRLGTELDSGDMYHRCYQVYNTLDNVMEWKLVCQYDADTLLPLWAWMKKS